MTQSNRNTVECSHCKGSGKEWASMSLDTGEVRYRTCPVCNGTGKVTAEKSHYTQYPDLSLQNALQLMQTHGKPTEICIAGNHDIRILFKDGSRYILGGFTVGYRGTGPEYTERLLDAAGFTISIDDIAQMEPPITLIAGQPYTAPKTLLSHGQTLEEAKKNATTSIPPDAKIITLEVVRDGTTLETVEGDGPTEDDALKAAKQRLPEGAAIERKDVRDESTTIYRYGSIVGEGPSEQAAYEHGKSQLPENWRAATEKGQIIKAGCQGKLTIKASTEDQARKNASTKLPKGATITSIHCTRQPRSGILGGPGTYEVTWTSPWRVQLVIRKKKITLTYRPKAAVKIRYQPPTEQR